MNLPASNSGTIAILPDQPKFQEEISFAVTGTDLLKNPRIWVAAYQNGELVYGEGCSPSETLKLGGDMSQWVLNGGGPAKCSVDLYYILNAKGTGEWNGHGVQGGTVHLAQITFDVSG